MREHRVKPSDFPASKSTVYFEWETVIRRNGSGLMRRDDLISLFRYEKDFSVSKLFYWPQGTAGRWSSVKWVCMSMYFSHLALKSIQSYITRDVVRQSQRNFCTLKGTFARECDKTKEKWGVKKINPVWEKNSCSLWQIQQLQQQRIVVICRAGKRTAGEYYTSSYSLS